MITAAFLLMIGIQSANQAQSSQFSEDSGISEQGYEFPEAVNSNRTIQGKCGSFTFSINTKYNFKNSVESLVFHEHSISRSDLMDINRKVSTLRSDAGVRYLCSGAGVTVVIFELFNRDKNPMRWVKFDFVKGRVSSLETSK